jgi:hypothetical protein
MPRSPIRIPRSEQGSYFCRVDRASFNLTNLVEDTVESVTAFALRYVYTNLILLWSPRAVVFHILKHNRWFRITRPYSYGFASFFLILVPPRRERRLFAPIYFGLTYIIALLLIMLGLAAVAEFLFRAFVAAPDSGGGFLGQRFLGSNHIRGPVLAYRTKCGRRGGG